MTLLLRLPEEADASLPGSNWACQPGRERPPPLGRRAPRAAGTARGGALLSHAAEAIRGPTEALHGLPINAELIVKGELLTLVKRFSSGL